MKGHDFHRRQEVGHPEKRRGKVLGAKNVRLSRRSSIIEGHDRQRSWGLTIR